MGDVDHALEFVDRMAPVVVISAAEIKGVIAGKEFRGVHHKADRLLCRQHLIEVDLEILVAEMDFNEVETAVGGTALNVVITNRQPKAMDEAVGAWGGCRGLEV